ncbi:MAG: Tad domain-containing protein [Chloroflexota bacterium]|nr:Tad domain-containing protein [Chloroflexota bacterium]
MHRLLSRTEDRGQILVIVAVGMIAFIAMVGLVIDGGMAWGQQRETQNAADSASKAGAVVIQHSLGGTPATDGDVGCAVETAAAENDAELESAEYTDHTGSVYSPSVPVGACGSGGAIPSGAQGVRAVAATEFDTYLMGIVGFHELPVSADATSVVGRVETICPPSAGCAVLPVTFPRTMDTCDGTNHREIGEDEWELLDPVEDTLDASNLVIVPLCSTGPGSVGWLDFGCGNLAQTITHPENCDLSFPIPAWLDTQTGNPNNLETELNDFAGTLAGVPEEADKVLYVPIHDFTCRDDVLDHLPTTSCPTYPTWSATGNLLHYHVPYWAGFKLDNAFVGGSDPECDQTPGSPPAGGNGATGCLKGWFVDLVGSPGPITMGPITPGEPVTTGVMLVN